MRDQEKLLREILDFKKRRRRVVHPPATRDALEALDIYSQTVQVAPLPENYRWLLSVTNGFSFNGYNIYGSVAHEDPFLDGFREVNDVLGGVPREHVFYGDTADELFVFDLRSKQFQAIDRPSFSLLEEFGDFDALLMHILRTSVGQLKLDAIPS